MRAGFVPFFEIRLLVGRTLLLLGIAFPGLVRLGVGTPVGAVAWIRRHGFLGWFLGWFPFHEAPPWGKYLFAGCVPRILQANLTQQVPERRSQRRRCLLEE